MLIIVGRQSIAEYYSIIVFSELTLIILRYRLITSLKYYGETTYIP